MSWVPNERIANQLSRSVPALAAHGERLHQVHLGDTSNDLWHSSFDGRQWTPNVRLPGQTSKAAPALASFGGRLHLVHLGESSNDLWHSSSVDGEVWSPNVKIADQKSKATPALAVWGGRLHLVHLGDTSNDLWHSTFDGRQWSKNVKLANQKSKATPALAAWGGRLHLVHLGDTSNDLWHSSFDGHAWSPNVTISGQHSSRAPALAAFEDELLGFGLHLVHGGDTSNDLWHSVFDGQAWSPNVKLPGQKSKSPPAVAAFGGLVHCLHLGDTSNAVWHSWFEGPMGRAMTGRVPIADGQAIYFEWGCAFRGPSTGGAVLGGRVFAPRLGNPSVVTTAPRALLGLSVSFGADIPLLPATRRLIAQQRPYLFEELWAGRLALHPVGAAGPEVPLQSSVHENPNGRVGLALSANVALEHRRLYDLVLHRPGQASAVVAAHSVYARTDWNEFTLAHATDLHVSARTDTFRKRLADAARPESAEAYNSFNDDLRDFIRFANRQHARGALDAIVFTGDLVDFQFEKGQPRGLGGNFAVLESLLRGQSPYPAPHAIGLVHEELRVPVFMTLGNHDYRAPPYELLANIHFHGYDLKKTPQFSSMNLTQSDAEALQPGGTVDVASDAAVEMVRPHAAGLQYYFDRLNNSADGAHRSSFLVRLGQHRLVMIDTGPDVDIIDGTVDAIEEWLGFSNENERTFVESGPNSVGMTPADLELVKTALRETASTGVTLIGMHAPPVHIWGDEYPHYFRETEHATLKPELHQVEGYLRRQRPNSFLVPMRRDAFVAPGGGAHGAFTRTGTPWFMEGSPSDLLDFSIAKQHAEELLQLCCGVGQPRAVDLVLCGHTHLALETRVQWAGNKPRFFIDFYTEHPARFYRSKYSQLPSGQSTKAIEKTIAYDIEVVAGASLPVAPPANTTDQSARRVPPYADELAHTADPRQWWARHRPLIVETAGLGPIESNQRVTSPASHPAPTFHGVRLVTVKNDVITRVHLATFDELRRG